MIREELLADTYEVELVASELVTNVIRHAKTDLVFSLDVDETTVRIEVFNHSGIMPAVRELSHGSNTPVGGAGLRLVEEISERWGAEPRPEGKIVWAEIRRAQEGSEDAGRSNLSGKTPILDGGDTKPHW